MPNMQVALSAMNAAFGAEALDGADRDVVEIWRPTETNTLVDSMRAHSGVDLPEAILAFVDTYPSGLKRAVQAVIWENFSREARVPITFAWAPAYDYSITVYDVVDTDKSRGGITVLFTSRYPADAHPLSSTSAR